MQKKLMIQEYETRRTLSTKKSRGRNKLEVVVGKALTTTTSRFVLPSQNQYYHYDTHLKSGLAIFWNFFEF